MKNRNDNTVGVIVGRFQIDELHDGHRALLDHVTKKHERVVILLGVVPAPANKKNPLSFEIRRSMINSIYPDTLILPISDQRSDVVWSQDVDTLLRLTVAESPIKVYSGRSGFGGSYHGRHEVILMNFDHDVLSSTNRRNALKTPKFNNADFRAGIIHSMMTRAPRTDRTVDMAVFNKKSDGTYQLALARKYNEVSWRLPGGFVDPVESDEQAASRETGEEIGFSVEIATWKYIGNYGIEDWRCANVDDHYLRTTLFATILPWHSRCTPGDDIQEAKWYDVDDVQDSLIVHEHIDLVKNAMNWLNANTSKEK